MDICRSDQLLASHVPHQDAERLTWDKNGNLTSRSAAWQTTQYQYDPADRQLSEGNTHNSYDSNGNLVSKGQGWGAQQFDYDALGRLERITNQDGNNSTYSYGYDALDRRVSVDYQDWRQWQTWVLYDGRQEREQYDVSNQGLLRHLSYVPQHLAGQYGQLIRQQTWQPQHELWGSVGQELKNQQAMMLLKGVRPPRASKQHRRRH